MKTSMQISVPPSLKEWVEEQIAAEGHDSASAFFQTLVRKERKRRLQQELEKSLLASLDSGESTPMTAGDWEKIRLEGKKRLARKRK
jgi:antitoxin ParD1/3/4